MAALLDSMHLPIVGGSLGQPPNTSRSDEFMCRWDNCNINFATGEELYNHLCTDHVIRRPKHYVTSSGGRDAQPERSGSCDSNGSSAGSCNGSAGNRPSDAPTRLHCHWKHCNVVVQKRDHMTSHIRIHINMKPYACHCCDKKFKRTQDLKKHLRTHPESQQSSAMKARERHTASLATAQAPTPKRIKKREREEVPVEVAKKPCTELLQEQLKDISKMRGSDIEKRCAVTASLKLLADVHSSQVKPEFSDSLAERLDTISLILQDENILQRVSDKVTKSYPNSSEQLGELNEFLEQVSENITEQQLSMRMKHEEQPLSEIVYSSMKPIFPPLPFEAGTEADFVSGPNYYAEMPDTSQSVVQPEFPPQGNFTPSLAPQPDASTLDLNPMRPESTESSRPDLAFERVFKDIPGFSGNTTPSQDTVLPTLPEAREEQQVTDALDYYLTQVETQITAEHALQVTSGLRNLINDAIEPGQAGEDQQHQHHHHQHQHQYLYQKQLQTQEQFNQGMQMGQYSLPHTTHMDFSPPHLQHLQYVHPATFNEYRADMHF